MLPSGGQNRHWPTNGQIVCITPAVWGVPYSSKRGTKAALAHKNINMIVHGVFNASKRGTKSAMAYKWAIWLHPPCHRWGGGHNASQWGTQ